MKHLSIHIPFTALLLLLSGCTQNEPFAGEGEGAGGGTNAPATVPLRISSLLTADVETTPARSTRAAAAQDYPQAEGNSIGFYVKEDLISGYDASTNLEGTFKNGAWQPVTDIKLNANTATVAVYAPFDSKQSTANPELPLAAVVLTTANASKDILSARATGVSKANSSISLTMTHIYSLIKINVIRGENYLAYATISGLSLRGTNIYPTATFRPLEASPYVYPGTVDFGFSPANLTLKKLTSSVTYDLLMIPATLPGDLMLRLTIDAIPIRALLPASKFSGALERGKQYTVNLTLRPGELSVSSVTIAPWTKVPVDGGDLELD